ncbi:hypothetical protein ACFO4E_27960 [Nocardiopsis mangrovi]|uniref:Lipoprotein n=1 Tax=Nocardiopsis mangrovi TaxID=1179818 RepID=A0ABV9E485_9ACTN
MTSDPPSRTPFRARGVPGRALGTALCTVALAALLAACGGTTTRVCGDYDLDDGRYIYTPDRGDYRLDNGRYEYVGCTTQRTGSGGWFFTTGGGSDNRNNTGTGNSGTGTTGGDRNTTGTFGTSDGGGNNRGGGPGWGK